ncbi:ADP-ribosylglycohydrolase family protein [Blautia schinkii]|nr:ADP-ribosylglycohydrolase family protein [Blautia schinkii]
MQKSLEEKVYAGVLGKIIGVFYGRPIEGWPYEKIRQTFGVVDHYVYKEAGTPLIVADDDVAGTFTFLNAVEDCRDVSTISAKDFGEAWLDYVIEDKTIFWWGGLGRSTEHTAYLRLKQGIPAPLSGSIELNGQAVAEQIGAQIFMDALAMMCPGDPRNAGRLVRELSSVSHDGIAVEAACFLASLEALAFEIRETDQLLDAALAKGVSPRLREIIDRVREVCSRNQDFRAVRQWLDEEYGYHLYPGNCHVIPNFALILASLILGGDDFYYAMEICISCGWDTDCNGANLGCINGIRLGLDAINEAFDFRGPVADRLYKISSNGGACVSDAVQETRRILAANAKLYGEKSPEKRRRYEFEFPGSVQGFENCPYLGDHDERPENSNMRGCGNGLWLSVDHGKRAVSVPVMFDLRDRQASYCLTASPVLYESQTVYAVFDVPENEIKIQLYIAWYDFDNNIQFTYSPQYTVQSRLEIAWKIPKLGGMPISRLGILCESDKKGAVILRHMDWDGAPEHFEISIPLRNYDIGMNMAMEAFVSSAKQFHFDARASFVISHTEKNGVATIGTEQWKDYKVTSVLEPGIHQRFGLLGRSRGHRRYYALMLWDHKYAGLVCKKGSEEICLVQIPFAYRENHKYRLELSMCGKKITGKIDEIYLEALDDTYSCGGAGFVTDEGTALAYGFCVEGLEGMKR